MTTRSRLALCLALLSLAVSAAAGASAPADPAAATGWRLEPVAPLAATTLAALPQLRFDALDRQLLAAEDASREAAGLPYRFAVPQPVFLTPATDGAWESRADGSGVWRLRITAGEAASLNFAFSRFHLPAGARLSIHAADGGTSLGPYTAADNRPHGELWTEVIRASDVVLELALPREATGEVELVLAAVNQGYRGFGATLRPDAAGLAEKSGACNVDVICPEGDLWRDIIRSVARYTRSGFALCSGAMINNTAQDRRPLFLTAAHCGITPNNASSVVTYWNFESSTCRPPGSPASGGPGNGGLGQSIRGALYLAGYTPTDFTLVELDAPPNPAWRVFWAGWDRGSGAPRSSIGIHHPQGDEKRICFEDDPSQVTSYLGNSVPGDSTHLRVVDWDLGTTEGGSSGSPLFTHSRHIVGQLHGGFAACGNDASDWYGRLAVSWEGGGSPGSRLRDWLDPMATGQQTLGGVNQTAPPGSKPAAPSNLTAVALSASEVELTWQDNADNESELEVEAAAGAGSFTLVGTRTANTTTTVVSGLIPGTSYRFRVRARNAAGVSGYSNVASATTPAAGPKAPDRLVARTVSAQEVDLTWRDLAAGELSYEVEVRTVALLDEVAADKVTFVLSPFTRVAVLAANTTSYRVVGLTPDTTYNFRVRAVNAVGGSAWAPEVAATTESGTVPPPGCSNGPQTHCLFSGRFEVRAFFRNQHAAGATGNGTPVPESEQTVFYWFFRNTNLELVVKMLNGEPINGHYWVLFGSLSDVEYWIVVTDTESGNRASFYNPPGGFCGGADVQALPAGSLPLATTPGGGGGLAVASSDAGQALTPVSSHACVSGPETLCLLGGRFRVEVDWTNQHAGGEEGTGMAVPHSDQTGLFWFFKPENIELIVKMFDARTLNGKFWFFYGALSDVEYEIRVTDTESGATATYSNPPGNICGRADTAAFD